MNTSQQQQPYQIQIGLNRGKLDSEIRDANRICNDLRSFRNAFGLLLDLCNGNRKIDPVHLRSFLEMLEDSLEEIEDVANGQRRLFEDFVPAYGSQKGDGNDKEGLHLVPSI